MVHLLKKKSRVEWKQKDRKKYQPLLPTLDREDQKLVSFKDNMQNLAKKASDNFAAQKQASQQDQMQIDSHKGGK